MSASETPKSRFETSSFPPVSTPAPAPKPLSNRSCCHFSGSCFGCNETRTSLTVAGAPPATPPAPPGADKGPPGGPAPRRPVSSRPAAAARAGSGPGSGPPPRRRAPRMAALPARPGRAPYPAVGRGPVPAAAPGHHRPVPHGAADSRSPGSHAAPAGPAPAGGAAPAPAAPAAAPAGPALAPVELNDIVQGHVHLVGHDGGSAPGACTSGRAALTPEAEEAWPAAKARRPRALVRGSLAGRDFRRGGAGLPAGRGAARRAMRVRVRSWHGVASWLWVANDENCGICRMAFNGCCPDCECGGAGRPRGLRTPRPAPG